MTTSRLHKLMLDLGFNAADLPFDGTGTGLASNNVDAALTELDATRAFNDRIRGINAQTGTSYTAVFADAGKLITFGNAAATNFTIPPNASVAFPITTFILTAQRGAGQVTVVPGSGVTIESYLSRTKLAGAGAQGALIKLAVNTWGLYGALA